MSLIDAVGRRRFTLVPRASVLCLVASGLISSCSKDRPEPRATTGQPPFSAPKLATDSAVPATVMRWDTADGSAIYIPGEGAMAQVILPPVMDDSVPSPAAIAIPANAAPAAIDLFAPSGKVGSATLGEFAASAQPGVGDGCDAWPVVPVRESGVTNTPQSWRLALQAGVAQPLHADSIGALSRGDSAQLVVAINKAAALLPLDSAAILRRVPFSVTKAYRMLFPGNVEAVVAVVERRLNVEASPRVERTVMVLERAPRVSVYSAVWRETQYATEDDLIAVDLLAVVKMHGAPRPTVFLGLDFGDGSRIQMLQRTNGGIWSLRWSSAYTGC